MIRARFVALFASTVGTLLVLLVGCAQVERAGQDAAAEGPRVPKQLQARQVIVTLGQDTPERWTAITQALVAEYQLREVGNFPLDSIRVQCVVFQIPSERPLDAVLAQLRADPRVESVQPNQVFEGLQASHSDPYASLIYGAASIGAVEAHRTRTGKGIKVAVVDTGADRDHPDLRGQIVKITNFVEGGERTFSRDRHGTAVIGIIAARADDGVGIFGVAPEAEVSAIKACWYPAGKNAKALCSSWTLAKAVDFAINAGAQVLNLSLSGPSDPLLARLIHACARPRHADGCRVGGERQRARVSRFGGAGDRGDGMRCERAGHGAGLEPKQIHSRRTWRRHPHDRAQRWL